MTIDIKTVNIEPRRHTFGHVARRLGADRPASRYEEGTLDVQATDHFHYKPLWEPEYWIYDPRKTAVKMGDWYALRDPRQYYYATYNIARANMHQAVDRNFALAEKRGMYDQLAPDWRERVVEYLLPMRHVAWGGNMNMAAICERGYGTAVTAPCIFAAADQLGMAQILSRIGLALDGNSGDSLEKARDAWLNASYWQGVRKQVENSFVVKDWFELFVAQTVALDGILHRLAYDSFDIAGQRHGGTVISLLTEFMRDWREEHETWSNAVIRTAAAESDDNKRLISGWARDWIDAVSDAARPLAEHVLGGEGAKAVQEVTAEVRDRCAKIGLAL